MIEKKINQPRNRGWGGGGSITYNWSSRWGKKQKEWEIKVFGRKQAETFPNLLKDIFIGLRNQ